MIEIIHGRVASLLARLFMWSLVTVPCYWLPILAGSWYDCPDVGRYLVMPCCAGFPFLLYALGVTVLSLVQLFKALWSRPPWQCWLLGLTGLLLSAPCILPPIVFCIRIAVSGGAPDCDV